VKFVPRAVATPDTNLADTIADGTCRTRVPGDVDGDGRSVSLPLSQILLFANFVFRAVDPCSRS